MALWGKKATITRWNREKRRTALKKETFLLALWVQNKVESIYLIITHICPLSHHYPTFSYALFVFNWTPFPPPPFLSYLPDSSTLVTLFLSACPQAKDLSPPFHSCLLSVILSPWILSLSFPPLASPCLQPCWRDKSSVCTIHWSWQTPVLSSLLHLPLSAVHTHTHTGDEGKMWSKTLQWII